MKTKKQNWEVARAVASAVGKSLYEQGSLSSTEEAERALEGRSYYYSPGTRKYFGCRVRVCQPELEGLLLFTVESVQPPCTGRKFRAVVFDLLGNVAHRSCDGLPISDSQWAGFSRIEAAAKDGREAIKRMGTVRQEALRVLAEHKKRLRSALKSACAVRV